MAQKEVAPSASDGRAQLEMLESGVAVLRLGSPDERVVTITVNRMQSIRSIIEKLQSEKPKALIITGPHDEMFTAGADISLINSVKDAAQGEAFAREGQKLFESIEALPFLTIAAISGPCVGGGCEMALACKVRIITDHKSSVIGLPEIKLGILPGFGGTQRLPRLIGVPRALDIILSGKTLRPRQALSAGLVHEVVIPHKLRERCEQIALGNQRLRLKKPKLIDRVLGATKFGRDIVQKKAAATVKRETKGFFPAPPAALDCVMYGLAHGMQAGLEREAHELGRLIVTPECKALVRLFFLSEGAKALGKGARKSIEHLHAVVTGAGVMGAGIAAVLAKAECSVILKDTTEEAISRAQTQIKTYLSKLKYLSDAERSFILNRLELTTRDSSNIGNANFAIEAVFEDMEVKKQVLSAMAKQMPQDSIVATNTSSLSVTEIAKAIDHPERVVGMHFFNPVEKMPLVEIVMGQKTNDKTIAVIAALTTRLGKYPIVVQDVPGFLVNRVLTPYLNEAAFLFKEGYRIEDIDRAATAFGLPMGPVRLLDEVGLDVAAHVSEIMRKGYGARMEGPSYAKELVAAGRKGKKNRAGFYDYGDDNSHPSPALRGLLKLTEPEKFITDIGPITERLTLALINEAVRCLDEGVAGRPGPEAANQIDLGLVMGIGFPPHRGGILYYADTIGAKALFEKLSALEKQHGLRFKPTDGIRQRALTGKSFLDRA